MAPDNDVTFLLTLLGPPFPLAALATLTWMLLFEPCLCRLCGEEATPATWALDCIVAMPCPGAAPLPGWSMPEECCTIARCRWFETNEPSCFRSCGCCWGACPAAAAGFLAYSCAVELAACD